MAASHVANYQYYVSGQLKTNVQSRLDYLSDVFLNLSELVQKYDSENRQMKEFIAVLLHFKYMLQFLKTNLIRDDDLFKKLGPDAAILFKTDLKQCMSKFNQVVASSACFDFVNDKNDYYRMNGANDYCSYNEDDIAPILPMKSRFRGSGGNGFIASSRKSTNYSNTSISQVNAELSSDRGDMTSNASDSEHLEIKLEPDVEIIEPPHQTVRLDSTNESDDSRPADARSSNSNNNSNMMLTAMLDKPINAPPSQQPSTSSSHKSTRDKNNDLKLTIVTTPQSSRKILLKRSIQSFQEGVDDTPSNNASSSNNNNSINNNSKGECCNNGSSTSFQKKLRPAKSNINYNLERDNSREEDYDFDYEKEDYEFDEEDFANFNSTGQTRCPQSGCGLVFDSGIELTEHMKNAHFTMMDFNTFECLVEGCNEKFPNLARSNVHMKNAHPDEYITCDQCLKQVKAHYLRKHFYMRHRKGVYKCSQDCDYIAEYYHELEKHRYMVHNSRSYGNWAEGSGSSGLGASGGFGTSSNPSSSNSGNNVFFPSNPIAAAIVNHQANNNNSLLNNQNSNNSEEMMMPPNRARRFLCKFNDCNYWHESRLRVLQHIRTQHLANRMNTRNGGAVAAGGSSSTGVGDDRASEYLETYEFPESSFYD